MHGYMVITGWKAGTQFAPVQFTWELTQYLKPKYPTAQNIIYVESIRVYLNSSSLTNKCTSKKLKNYILFWISNKDFQWLITIEFT